MVLNVFMVLNGIMCNILQYVFSLDMSQRFIHIVMYKSSSFILIVS